MRLPRWLRHGVAHYSAAMAEERGGDLYDYANGQWKLLHTWKGLTDKTALAITEAMLNAGSQGALQGSYSVYEHTGRDAIYVCHIVLSDGCGVFQVLDSTKKIWERFWAIGMYNPEEAYVDTCAYLKKRAVEMGWPSTDRNHTSSNVLDGL